MWPTATTQPLSLQNQLQTLKDFYLILGCYSPPPPFLVATATTPRPQPQTTVAPLKDFYLILDALFIPLPLQNPLHTLKAHHPDLGSLKAFNLGCWAALGLETCPCLPFAGPLPCPISPQNQLQSLKDFYLMLESYSPPPSPFLVATAPQPSAPRMS